MNCDFKIFNYRVNLYVWKKTSLLMDWASCKYLKPVIIIFAFFFFYIIMRQLTGSVYNYTLSMHYNVYNNICIKMENVSCVASNWCK